MRLSRLSALRYIDIVLFDKDGYELACAVGEDTIEGEFSFETKDAIYKGMVKSFREKEIISSALPLDKIIEQANQGKTEQASNVIQPFVAHFL